MAIDSESIKKLGWKGVVSAVLKGAVFIFPGVVLFVDHYASALLVLGLAGAVLLVRKCDVAHVDRSVWIMAAAMASMFFASVVQWAITDRPLLEFAGWERAARYLLFLPLFFVFRKLGLSDRFFLHSALWGMLFVGAYAVMSFLASGERVEGAHSESAFGNISLLFGCLCFLGIKRFKRRRVLVLLACIAGISGLVASALSGTRGGWLAAPFLLIIVLNYLLSGFARWKRILSFCLLLALLVGAGASLPIVRARVAVAQRHYRQYLSGEKTDTSVGVRIEMWKKAWGQFKEHPILGNGHNSFEFERIAYTKKKIPYVRKTFYQSHNLYLSEMARGGVVGLAALLFLFGYPLYWFGARAKNSPLASACGVAVVVAYLVFGLTDDTFARALFISLYVTMMAWSMTLVSSNSEKE
jgi:O-antigen ligase